MFVSAKQFFAAAAVFGAGLAASSVAGAATLNIVGCDSFSGDPATGTITCVTSTTPPSPTAPSGCTATATPSVLATAAGGTVQLSASCTGGAAVVSQTWTRTRSGVATQLNSLPDTVPDNSLASTSAVYTYTARLCAADGTSCASATTGTVTVPAGVAPPPSASSCGNLPIITPVTDDLNAIPSDLTFNNQRFVAKNFTGTNVVVGTIKVPVNAAGKSAVNVYEHASPNPIQRRIWLSKTRCDMTATSGPSTTSMSTSLSIKVGGSQLADHVYMLPGETWYVMIKNETLGFGGVPKSTCATNTSCDIGIRLYTLSQ